MSYESDLLEYVGTPAVPFRMTCDCGQKLRVATGTWAKNGLPCAWAMCAKCKDKAGDRKVWCPFDGHVRRQATFKPGVSNTGDGERSIPSCQTGTCGYKHREMMDDIDVWFHRGGSEDAWEAALKWEKLAVAGRTDDWESIQARQMCRIRKFLHRVAPALKTARSKAAYEGRPEPSLKALMASGATL